MDIKRLARLVASIDAKRDAVATKYDEVASFIFPERAGFVTRRDTQDDGRGEIFDSTAEEANTTLAAALHSLLTNPASAWFALDLLGAEKESKEETEWLTEVQRVMLDVFSSPETGFQNEVNSFYLDLGPFGWAVFYTEDEAGKPIRFRAVPPARASIAENADGQVDTLVLHEMKTCSQLHEDFGDKVSDQVRQTLERDPQAEVEIVHVIMPRAKMPGRQGGMRTTPHAMASVIYEKATEQVLSESGFHERPFQVPRWAKVSGGLYGSGPGWAALPDMRVLNEVARSQLIGAEKLSDPPLMLPDDGVVGKLRSDAGGITYYKTGFGDKIIPLPITADIGVMEAIIEKRQDSIRRRFLNDRIMLAGGPQMTAFEVATRENKQMLVLGPVLGRLQTEFLGPLIERVFGILYRRGELPPAPDSLRGRDLRVRYVSPIARAQKQVEAAAFNQAVQYLAPVAQMDGSVLDNFDADAIARDTQELFGYPAKYLRGEDQVKKLREARAQAQQAREGMEAMRQMAQAANAAAGAGRMAEGQ